MEPESLTITSRIDEETYREFAAYDALVRRKRWRRPVLLGAALCLLSALAFTRTGEGWRLLGRVLLSAGAGVPLAYLLGLTMSVRRRIRQEGESVYTVSLDETGIAVRRGRHTVVYSWTALRRAHRLRRCVCLYVNGGRAFLLTERQEEAWDLLSRHLSPSRLR